MYISTLLSKLKAFGYDSPINQLPNATANQDKISTIYTVVIGIFAAVSFLVMVLGGLRYILANGDPSAISKAKNTILFAAIGLVISMSAYAIVAFVIGAV